MEIGNVNKGLPQILSVDPTSSTDVKGGVLTSAHRKSDIFSLYPYWALFQTCEESKMNIYRTDRKAFDKELITKMFLELMHVNFPCKLMA